MEETQKQAILQKTKHHLVSVTKRILESKTRVDASVVKLRHEIVRARGEERDTKEGLLYQSLDTQRNMEQQYLSPYFVRCDVLFDDEKESKTLYFGKFPYTAESIYSWVANASVIRFETPGRFTYETPTGETRSGTLLRKDQFLIVNGSILFLSHESETTPRELIYQEYFSQKKTEFTLKEIVEQMEKAQDTIIRSHYFGSFLISGPAGSGKTTLALHRAAYLIQSPDTAALFPEKKVIIFVHDETTKNYFSSLLPKLGIHKITITTFHEWAIQILGLRDMIYILRYGKTEREKDEYEYAKKRALDAVKRTKVETNIYKTLATIYENSFSAEQKKLFSKQKQQGVVDRFDLTILLRLMIFEQGQLYEQVEKFVRLVNGRYVKRIVKQQVVHSLVVLDEAQNYLADQISVIKGAVDIKTKGMIYVGDLVQRTLPYTLSSWGEVAEEFAVDRKVVLQKVYRNTKEILEYIASVGFQVSIPEQAKRGNAVKEYIVKTDAEEMGQIVALVEGGKDSVIGILAKSDELLRDYKKHFAHYENVHVLTINESQGVEFDTVILMGIDKDTFGIDSLPAYLREERKRVNRDLVYVALTRAMNELVIIGKVTLKDIL